MPALRLLNRIRANWAWSKEASSQLLGAKNHLPCPSYQPCLSDLLRSPRMLRLLIGKQTQVSDYIIEAYKSVRLSTINLEMLVVNKEVKRSTVWLSSRKQTFARHKDIISNVGMGQPRTYSSTMARDVTKLSTINALPRLNKKMRNLTSSRRSLVNRPKWCVIALRWSLINKAGAVISVAGVPQNSKACTKMQCVGMTFRETYTPRL